MPRARLTVARQSAVPIVSSILIKSPHKQFCRAVLRLNATSPLNFAMRPPTDYPVALPHNVPELNALWTISMRRKKPLRHSCVRCLTHRQRFVATGAGRLPTQPVLRRGGSTLVEFLQSERVCPGGMAASSDAEFGGPHNRSWNGLLASLNRSLSCVLPTCSGRVSAVLLRR